jgi:rhodanese-related sulfurtransferase
LDLFNDFEEARLLEIAAKTQEIVIYGRAATRYPAMACAKAVNWGFERVYCFVAGFEEWRQAGYPIEKGN